MRAIGRARGQPRARSAAGGAGGRPEEEAAGVACRDSGIAPSRLESRHIPDRLESTDVPPERRIRQSLRGISHVCDDNRALCKEQAGSGAVGRCLKVARASELRLDRGQFRSASGACLEKDRPDALSDVRWSPLRSSAHGACLAPRRRSGPVGLANKVRIRTRLANPMCAIPR